MIVMTVVIVNKVNDSGDDNDGPCIMTDDSDDINDDDNDMLTSSMGPLSPRQ